MMVWYKTAGEWQIEHYIAIKKAFFLRGGESVVKLGDMTAENYHYYHYHYIIFIIIVIIT